MPASATGDKISLYRFKCGDIYWSTRGRCLIGPRCYRISTEAESIYRGHLGGTSLTHNTFQSRVHDWFTACFSLPVQSNVEERSHRFLEEALELAQASGCTREDALSLVEYVYSRPEGDAYQETGGVLVTLAALSSTLAIDMELAGESELKRNWSRIDKIRAKQASKPQGTALPQ